MKINEYVNVFSFITKLTIRELTHRFLNKFECVTDGIHLALSVFIQHIIFQLFLYTESQPVTTADMHSHMCNNNKRHLIHNSTV